MAKKIEENDETKRYGNAFLGPNLWNKNELFQSDKFGVKFEYLDVKEFLAENEIDGVDFLDEIENLENSPKNKANTNDNNILSSNLSGNTNNTINDSNLNSFNFSSNDKEGNFKRRFFFLSKCLNF